MGAVGRTFVAACIQLSALNQSPRTHIHHGAPTRHSLSRLACSRILEHYDVDVPGPCTPIVSRCSMSAVRLGPVMTTRLAVPVTRSGLCGEEVGEASARFGSPGEGRCGPREPARRAAGGPGRARAPPTRTRRARHRRRSVPPQVRGSRRGEGTVRPISGEGRGQDLDTASRRAAVRARATGRSSHAIRAVAWCSPRRSRT